MGKFGDIFQKSVEETPVTDDLAHGDQKQSPLRKDRAFAFPPKPAGAAAGPRRSARASEAPAAKDRALHAEARLRGKSASYEYRQVTAYLRCSTHDAARRLLIGREEDLSDVLERLLAKWVAGNGNE